jgi:hypothetical protein
MTDETETPETDDAAGSTWKETLVRDRWRLLGIALLVAAIAAYFGWEIEIPRWAKLFVVTLVIGGFLGAAPADRLVSWLFRPSFTYLVDVDARTDDFAVWKLPPDAWRELEVDDGELHQVRATAPAWECESYDPETNTATGTWRGSASDLELVEDRERIDEIKTELEDLAKEGLSIRIKQSGIVRSSVRTIVKSFVEGFERETLYDGSAIEDAVTDALSHWEESDDDQEADDDLGDDGTEAEANVGKPETAGLPATTDGGTDE